MEIASPLAFSHATTGTKRSFPCSPASASNAIDSTMMFCAPETQDSHSGMTIVNNFQNQQFKRRRRLSNEHDDSSPSTNKGIGFSSSLRSAGVNSGSSFKRTRCDNNSLDVLPVQGWNQVHAQQQINSDLQAIVEKQSSELQRLKMDKAEIETRMSEMKASLEKTTSENRILKRAVTIQQERQNQATSELDAACKYRAGAEERIRRLEQMVNTLRFHLQTTNPGPVNNFMGFGPQPPGVC